jgi:hypothetical protein
MGCHRRPGGRNVCSRQRPWPSRASSSQPLVPSTTSINTTTPSHREWWPRRPRNPSRSWPQRIEFLTHKTTCANVMSKKTTSKNFCKKRPPLGGGTAGQATRGTCRLGQRRHGGAATAVSGTSPGRYRRQPLRALPPGQVPACSQAACHHPRWRHPGRYSRPCADSHDGTDSHANWKLCQAGFFNFFSESRNGADFQSI